MTPPTGSSSSDDLGACSLPELLSRRAKQQGNALAYRVLLDAGRSERTTTYRELHDRACSIAAHLCQQGVAGGRIALLYPTGLEFIEALFGTLYAGATAVPLNIPGPPNSVSRLCAILTDIEASAMLSSQTMYAKLCSLPPLRIPSLKVILTDAITSSQSQAEIIFGGVQSTAIIQYTSGSTSTPKGVLLTHSNLLHNAAMMARVCALSTKSIGVNWLPLFHDMGLMGGVVQPLFSGFPATLLPPIAFLARPELWLQTIARLAATVSGAPNFAFDVCVDRISAEKIAALNLDLSRWEIAYSGAEPVRANTVDHFVKRFGPCGFKARSFFPCYGLAEATLIVAGGPKGRGAFVRTFSRSSLEKRRVVAVPNSTADSVKLVSCGQPVRGQSILMVDPQTHEVCQDGDIGEIWISGPNVAKGYWNCGADARRAFAARIGRGARRFLRSGDLGFFWGAELFVVGRLKDLIIIRGFNYYPEDIELTAEGSCGAIKTSSSAAFSLEVDGEEQVMVVLETERGWRGDSAIVFERVRRRIAEYHGLSIFALALVRPGALPRTTSGKIQRHRVRQLVVEGNQQSLGSGCSIANRLRSHPDWDVWVAGMPGESAKVLLPYEVILKIVIGIWAEVLNSSSIGVDDNFFDLGGNSGSLIRVHARLSEALGAELPIACLFRFPTVRSLCECLNGMANDGERLRPAARRADDRQTGILQTRRRQIVLRPRRTGPKASA